jgi:hypothetical protein
MEMEVVATPITGDSNDQRVFLADVENIKEESLKESMLNYPVIYQLNACY